MIFIPAKLDILSIRARDALLEIQAKSDDGLAPARVILWYLENDSLEKEIGLHSISPAVLKKHYPIITKFQKIRYFFKNYLLLYRYLGECKKAVGTFAQANKTLWLNRYQRLAQNELDLYCGDIIDSQVFIRNSYNLKINNSFFAPIVDFLELYETESQRVNNNF